MVKVRIRVNIRVSVTSVDSYVPSPHWVLVQEPLPFLYNLICDILVQSVCLLYFCVAFFIVYILIYFSTVD